MRFCNIVTLNTCALVKQQRLWVQHMGSLFFGELLRVNIPSSSSGSSVVCAGGGSEEMLPGQTTLAQGRFINTFMKLLVKSVNLLEGFGWCGALRDISTALQIPQPLQPRIMPDKHSNHLALQRKIHMSKLLIVTLLIPQETSLNIIRKISQEIQLYSTVTRSMTSLALYISNSLFWVWRLGSGG